MGSPSLEKAGLRGLTIAESFERGAFGLPSARRRGAGGTGSRPPTAAAPRSVLAGVVMRRDLVIDGLVLGSATLGGDDATGAVLEMYRRLGRSDIRYILVSGLIVSLYNIIDIAALHRSAGVPVIGMSRRRPGRVEPALRHHFPDSFESKVAQYRGLGRPERITLETSCDVYVRTRGCAPGDAARLLSGLTRQGSVPEPVRVARMLARAMLRMQQRQR